MNADFTPDPEIFAKTEAIVDRYIADYPEYVGSLEGIKPFLMHMIYADMQNGKMAGRLHDQMFDDLLSCGSFDYWKETQ